MTPDPLTLAAAEQARSVAVQMMTERGRGLVLVGAARLDLALEHLLKAVMAPSAEPDDKLFTPDRSLGSYGAKISLAARLGLIAPANPRWRKHAIRSGSSGSTPKQRHHRSGGRWPLCSKARPGSPLMSRPSSCWSPRWWPRSKPAPCFRSPSLLGPPCASNMAEAQQIEAGMQGFKPRKLGGGVAGG